VACTAPEGNSRMQDAAEITVTNGWRSCRCLKGLTRAVKPNLKRTAAPWRQSQKYRK
jgi:hypothetical protein